MLHSRLDSAIYDLNLFYILFKTISSTIHNSFLRKRHQSKGHPYSASLTECCADQKPDGTLHNNTRGLNEAH